MARPLQIYLILTAWLFATVAYDQSFAQTKSKKKKATQTARPSGPPESQKFMGSPPPPSAKAPATTHKAKVPPKPRSKAVQPDPNDTRIMGIVTPPDGGKNGAVYDEEGYDNRYCKRAGLDECHSVMWPKAGTEFEVLDRVNVAFAPAARNDDQILSYYEVLYKDSEGKVQTGFIPVEYLTVAKKSQVTCRQVSFGGFEKLHKNIVEIVKKVIPTAPPPIPTKKPAPPKLTEVKYARLDAQEWNEEKKRMEPVFNSKCRNFMDSKGNVGEWGRMVADAINEINPSCIYNGADMTSVCPNFPKMSQEDKKMFWIYLFTVMGQKEASCDNEAKSNPKKVRNPNGVGHGLTALEGGKDIRKKNHRNPRYCPHETIDLTRPHFQLYCGVAIVDQIYCHPPRNIIAENTYWHGLMNTNTVIAAELIGNPFPGCK